jgi:hypothetical protein
MNHFKDMHLLKPRIISAPGAMVKRRFAGSTGRTGEAEEQENMDLEQYFGEMDSFSCQHL